MEPAGLFVFIVRVMVGSGSDTYGVSKPVLGRGYGSPPYPSNC